MRSESSDCSFPFRDELPSESDKKDNCRPIGKYGSFKEHGLGGNGWEQEKKAFKLSTHPRVTHNHIGNDQRE